MNDREELAVFAWLGVVIVLLWQIRNTIRQEHYNNQTFRQRFALHFPYASERADMDESWAPDHDPVAPEYAADMEEHR